MDAVALVRYNLAARRRFAEFFAKEVPWDVIAENHETSHQNIANAFMHGCNMEDWWLHYVWPGKTWDGPAYDGFTSAQAMLDRVLAVEKKTTAFLAELTPAKLEETRKISPSGSGGTDVKLATLMVESTLEDIHHRGEILAMLWRKDIAPPYLSWLEWSASGAK